MKCKHCGNQLSIEDERCPFCGKINEQAQKHSKAMRRYSKEFKKAKQQVANTNHLIKSFTVFLIIAVILAMGNAAVLYLRYHAWDICMDLEEKQVKRNAVFYERTLSEALDEEDLFTINWYYTHKDLYSIDKLHRFSFFSRIGSEYTRIYQSVMDIYDADIVGLSDSNDQLLSTAGNAIADFYKSYDLLTDTYSDIVSSLNESELDQAEKIKEKLELFLGVYCNIPAEQLAKLPDSSELQIALILGKGMGLHE